MGTVDCKCQWALLAVGILANCLLTCPGFVQAAPGSGHDDEAKKSDLRDKGLILVKIWCLVIVFAVTFTGGISPYFWRWNQSFLVVGTQFAGGVFLGTALMHFLSDSNQAFQDLGLKDYPMAFMLCSLGYVLTMLGDCVLLWVNQRNNVGNECGKGKEAAEEGDGSGGRSSGGGSRRRRAAATGESTLLILALCFHSVFEGMAVGVAESKGGAWRALWTVCLHKVFAATAMAIALLRMKPNRPFLSCVAYAFAFGISSPVGVSIGIIVDSTTEGPVARWLFAITMGLATGIFIYVALNHMLRGAHAQAPRNNSGTTREEDDDDGDDRHGPSLYNFLAFLLGVGVIAVAMIWDT
uniref:Zinc transporter n=1 Tax=Picea sitchensis TaxID=3332 RepID=A9NSI1_PICSI|nr:unknown [Picea sitchensis]